jgi:hypothetical protein
MNCQWYQFRIHRLLDEGSPLPARVLAHVKACARCESFYRDQVDVHERLSTPVDDQKASPSPFLKNRILNAIAREQCAPSSPASSRWIGVCAFAAVALVLTLVAIDYNSKPPREQVVISIQRPAPEWIEMTAKVTSGGSLFRVATNLNQPLQHEMDLVIQNAQAALSSLANEFVPSKLLATKD